MSTTSTSLTVIDSIQQAIEPILVLGGVVGALGLFIAPFLLPPLRSPADTLVVMWMSGTMLLAYLVSPVGPDWVTMAWLLVGAMLVAVAAAGAYLVRRRRADPGREGAPDHARRG